MACSERGTLYFSGLFDWQVRKMDFVSIFKSSRLYAAARSFKHRIKRKRLYARHESLSLDMTRKIIEVDLGIGAGDSVMVHCGFGYLNAEYTPSDLIELLQEIVTPSGNILMPFYPPGMSIDWAKSGRAFNPSTIKCSTGALAQEFSKKTDVKVSRHPTKAVLSWGKDSELLVSEHHESMYPFDKQSPYYKLAKIPGSKTIGLGVGNCSMVHCAEDVFEIDKSYLYGDRCFSLRFIENGVAVNVDTYVHHGTLSSTTHTFNNYAKKYMSNILTEFNVSGVYFYLVNNDVVLSACERLFEKGITRKKNAGAVG